MHGRCVPSRIARRGARRLTFSCVTTPSAPIGSSALPLRRARTWLRPSDYSERYYSACYMVIILSYV